MSIIKHLQMADSDADCGWFGECLQLLYAHRWVYDWPVTRLFVDEICQKIPIEWMECLRGLTVEELNAIPYGLIKEEWPESFVCFISTALKLSVCGEGPSIASVTVPADLRRGMTPKKQHEVSLLAALIDQKLRESSLNTIVDVGAGLGYLGQVLRRVYGYRVISLECDETRTHAANQRAQKQGETSDVSTTLTFDLQDDPEVMRRFGDLLDDVCKSPNGEDIAGDGSGHMVCLAGLHCCGDLSPTMLKYFRQLDQIGLLVCVSCCYHRMAAVPDVAGAECYRNFPMSRSCQAALDAGGFGNWCLETPAFRLAAQETRCKWRSQSLSEHQSHSQHVAYRAILELFCVQEGLELQKSSRQLVPKQKCEKFEDYVRAVLERATFTAEKEPENGKNPEEKLHNLFSQTERLFPLIEPITCLQVLLQPVLESLIHKDRLAYLHEHSLQAELLPLFDASISPRNTVLIAKRDKGITKT